MVRVKTAYVHCSFKYADITMFQQNLDQNDNLTNSQIEDYN